MNRFIAILLLSALTLRADTVRNYMVDPFTDEIDTNALIITRISTNILSSGGVVALGVPVRTPASPWTNTLSVGFYSVSNRALRAAYVINVPGTGEFYDATNILHSGFNTYVTATRSATSNEIVSALGFVPGTGNGGNAALATNALGATGALDTRIRNSQNVLMAFDVDSQTAPGLIGGGSYRSADSWATLLVTNSAFLGNFITVSNSAVASQTASNAWVTFTNEAGAFLDQTAERKYYFYFGGVNDLHNGYDGVETFGYITNTLQLAKDRGALVVLLETAPWYSYTGNWASNGTGASWNEWQVLTNLLKGISTDTNLVDYYFSPFDSIGNYTTDALHYNDEGSRRIASGISTLMFGGPGLLGIAGASGGAISTAGTITSTAGFGLQATGAGAMLALFSQIGGGSYYSFYVPRTNAFEIGIDGVKNFLHSNTNGHHTINASNVQSVTVGNYSSGTGWHWYGAFYPNVLAKTTNYTGTLADTVLSFNGSSLTFTLPSAVTMRLGKSFTIKNLNSTALTVARTSSQTIDGAASDDSLAQYETATYTSDGANWIISQIGGIGSGSQTNIAVAGVTNAGTMAYTNASAFVPYVTSIAAATTNLSTGDGALVRSNAPTISDATLSGTTTLDEVRSPEFYVDSAGNTNALVMFGASTGNFTNVALGTGLDLTDGVLSATATGGSGQKGFLVGHGQAINTTYPAGINLVSADGALIFSGTGTPTSAQFQAALNIFTHAVTLTNFQFYTGTSAAMGLSTNMALVVLTNMTTPAYTHINVDVTGDGSAVFYSASDTSSALVIPAGVPFCLGYSNTAAVPNARPGFSIEIH